VLGTSASTTAADFAQHADEISQNRGARGSQSRGERSKVMPLMNRLEEILRVKRSEIDQLRPRTAELQNRALEQKDFRGFRAALKRRDGELAVIAEIKKASPSAGTIADQFDPIAIARNYQDGGADAISVLTDETFFHGDLKHLAAVRNEVSLPILRKDFILDEIQIVESVGSGADAILLIVAALDDKQLLDLSAAAARYHLDVLVEVHTIDELDRALDIGAEIIGINNRDLATFAIDLSVTERLVELVPDEVVLVSESGFRSAQNVMRAQRCGVDAILVGEALMRGEISIGELRG
jgi:indole-3-glycerol phosphate synthase